MRLRKWWEVRYAQRMMNEIATFNAQTADELHVAETYDVGRYVHGEWMSIRATVSAVLEMLRDATDVQTYTGCYGLTVFNYEHNGHRYIAFPELS